MEKWWPLHEAELIVVGTLHPLTPYPWFDGWHLGGRIEVHEVLYGNAPSRELELRLLSCKWGGPGGCDIRRIWNHPNYPKELTELGIWCLKRGAGGTWRASAGWSGFDALSERAEYEEKIRRFKR